MFDFLGQYTHSLDDKGRLIVPSAYRDGLKGGLVLTRGTHRYLNLFPLDKWEALTRDLEALPVYTHGRPASLRRLILSYAVQTVPDSHGRVRIPDHLRAFAQIDDQAVLAGVGGHVEIWTPMLWQQMMDQLDTISIDDEQDDLLRI